VADCLSPGVGDPSGTKLSRMPENVPMSDEDCDSGEKSHDPRMLSLLVEVLDFFLSFLGDFLCDLLLLEDFLPFIEPFGDECGDIWKSLPFSKKVYTLGDEGAMEILSAKTPLSESSPR